MPEPTVPPHPAPAFYGVDVGNDHDRAVCNGDLGFEESIDAENRFPSASR